MNEEKLELRNFYHAVNVVLLVFLAGMIFYYHPRLPAKIPMHFAGDGTPNGWGGKGSLIGIFIIALGINGILYLIIFSMRWFSKHPSLLSIPYKDMPP